MTLDAGQPFVYNCRTLDMFVGLSLMMKRNRNDSGDFKKGKVPSYSVVEGMIKGPIGRRKCLAHPPLALIKLHR